MESLRELYKCGPGPSSSHTLAPRRACMLFKDHHPEATHYEVELYGSLSLTGVGHHTDKIIMETFSPKPCMVYFRKSWFHSFPNGLVIKGFDYLNNQTSEWTVYSLGGGSIQVLEEELGLLDNIYPHKNFEEIKQFCVEKNLSLAQYPFYFENNLEEYLNLIVSQMLATVKVGLNTTGTLPGPLKLPRIAKDLYLQAQSIDDEQERIRVLISAFAYAASEENAAGGICVTAPTLGASGVIAALIYYYYHHVGISRNKLVKALALGGVFGNVIKLNATISGAVGGCQAEVGTACSMASAMVAYLSDAPTKIIEYAAEIGMEHHLGLTCDPVGGYVMIPCIERNAAAALRALDAATMAKYIGKVKSNRVSFDNIVNTMNYTGSKLAVELKETSLGGLAIEIQCNDTIEEIVEEANNIEEVKVESMVEDKEEDYLSFDLSSVYSNLDMDDDLDEFEEKLNFNVK